VLLHDMAAEGEPLRYLYGFGDSWRHVVRIDEVVLAADAGEVPRL